MTSKSYTIHIVGAVSNINTTMQIVYKQGNSPGHNKRPVVQWELLNADYLVIVKSVELELKFQVRKQNLVSMSIKINLI